MRNQLLMKALKLFGFVLIALLAFTFLQLSSCNSDDKEIEIPDTGNNHVLPIVKITIDEKYLWSEDSGLFVVDHPVLWEFPSQVMYIEEGDTIFDNALGLRLKGNYSINLPNRSMGLYWRKKYGVYFF